MSTLSSLPLRRFLTLGFVAVLALVLSATGCDDGTSGVNPFNLAPVGGTAGSPASAPGQIVGKVTNRKGEPVADVKIEIYGSSFGSGQEQNITGRTKEDGTYSVKVPDGIYGATASKEIKYHGYKYIMKMTPVKPNTAEKSHEAKEGPVLDFVFKIEGEIDETQKDPAKRYMGGVAYVGEFENYVNDFSIRDAKAQPAYPTGTRFDITLTPDGPLLDGTQGSVINRTVTLEEVPMWNRYWLADIPLGRYHVSATITEPDSSATPAKISTGGGNGHVTKPTPPASTATLTFYPTDFSPLARGVWPSKIYIMR